MCCLFGFYRYGSKAVGALNELTNALAEQATARGTDATGIAYNDKGRLVIHKEPKSAHLLKLKHPEQAVCVTGHTRHATQGNKRNNYNNHPFRGSCQNLRFALSHNGILVNDTELKRQYDLPGSRVETDSYVAVQLLEKKKRLDKKSVQFMAEAVDGSFAFSILDSSNVLWLVRGDSPLSLIHLPEYKLYVYASTDEILYKALVDTVFFQAVKEGHFKEIKIRPGDILRILPDSTVLRDTFHYEEYRSFACCRWWDYGSSLESSLHSAYIDDLKTIAACRGYTPEDIDAMVGDGFTPEEIEEYMYCCE